MSSRVRCPYCKKLVSTYSDSSSASDGTLKRITRLAVHGPFKDSLTCPGSKTKLGS